MKKIGLLIFLILGRLDGYITKYTRLCHGTKKIDILYNSISNQPLPQNFVDDDTPYTKLRALFSLSERRVLDALVTAQGGSVEVIWEFSPEYVIEDLSFINFAPGIIRRYMPKIRFTQSATVRLDAKYAILDPDFRQLTDWSIEQALAPLNGRRGTIEKNSGSDISQRYLQRYSQIMADIGSWWHSVQPNSWEQETERALAGLTHLELLTNVLSANTPKIIVHATAEQAQQVEDFLKEHSCTVLFEHHAQGAELSANQLNALDAEYKTPAAKKAPAKKTVPKKAAPKKLPVKKPTAKKVVARKAVPKKGVQGKVLHFPKRK